MYRNDSILICLIIQYIDHIIDPHHDTLLRVVHVAVRYAYCDVPNSCAVRNNSVGWKINSCVGRNNRVGWKMENTRTSSHFLRSGA